MRARAARTVVLLGACLAVAAAAGRPAAGAEVVISINKSTQSMTVLVDGAERHQWVVSTGLGGGPHDGSYKAGRMERKWFSRKYNWAPMPHSIFFDGNYAIHGTYHIKRLGRPASKGCVRLHPKNAATLFELVRANHDTTTVVVSKTTHVAARPLPEKTAPAMDAVAKSGPVVQTDDRGKEAAVQPGPAPIAASAAAEGPVTNPGPAPLVKAIASDLASAQSETQPSKAPSAGPHSAGVPENSR